MSAFVSNNNILGPRPNDIRIGLLSGGYLHEGVVTVVQRYYYYCRQMKNAM